MNIGMCADTDTFDSKNRKIWILFLLLAILLHLLVFLIHLNWAPAVAPKKMEIQHIDPNKLDAIRRQWKEKSLLLNKDPSQFKDAEAPPDARYMSDRNSHVEKEQRARETNVIPKAG